MLQVKNEAIVNLVTFLEKLELTPKASRVRTKLNKLLGSKVEELYKDEMDLLDRFGKKDEAGKLIQSEGAYSLIEDTALNYHQEKAELLSEIIHIEVRELHEKLPVLIEELENSEEKLSGQQAEIFDDLMDLLEDELKKNT
ncbi:DUF1617 family protein [Lactococcus garvieae]|uniref:DUF1617 family protein n=1 Tax=Lactococcus garvieae TaxID=1363 RepID=UPI0038549DE7